MLLAIDTSTRYAGIALAHGGQVISIRNWYSKTNHSANLIPAISDVLKQLEISIKDLVSKIASDINGVNISVVGDKLTFTVAGGGSTTLTLS